MSEASLLGWGGEKSPNGFSGTRKVCISHGSRQVKRTEMGEP